MDEGFRIAEWDPRTKGKGSRRHASDENTIEYKLGLGGGGWGLGRGVHG